MPDPTDVCGSPASTRSGWSGVDAGHHAGGVEDIEGVPPQVSPPGMPERRAVARRRARVREPLHTLPQNAQEAIREDLEGANDYHDEDADTASIPAGRHR
jgi:phospholipid/cholesterol/gamma-HCH transport system ATP-binding protein